MFGFIVKEYSVIHAVDRQAYRQMTQTDREYPTDTFFETFALEKLLFRKKISFLPLEKLAYTGVYSAHAHFRKWRLSGRCVEMQKEGYVLLVGSLLVMKSSVLVVFLLSYKIQNKRLNRKIPNLDKLLLEKNLIRKKNKNDFGRFEKNLIRKTLVSVG